MPRGVTWCCRSDWTVVVASVAVVIFFCNTTPLPPLAIFADTSVSNAANFAHPPPPQEHHSSRAQLGA